MTPGYVPLLVWLCGHTKAKLQVILLSGGLSANTYFRQKLKQEFNPHNLGNGVDVIHVYDELRQVIPQFRYLLCLIVNRECPVARGGLIVRDFLDQSKVTPQIAGGLLNVNEEYDPKIHRDAVGKDGNLNPNLVFNEPWESAQTGKECPVVEDRIKWLINIVRSFNSWIFGKN